MAYNGWTNWETWNVNLWIMNDEPLYRQWTTAGRDHEGGSKWTIKNVQQFVRRFFGHGTPDMIRRARTGGDPLLGVNWQELADNWNEARRVLNPIDKLGNVHKNVIA
jgi:hypothetical protein